MHAVMPSVRFHTIQWTIPVPIPDTQLDNWPNDTSQQSPGRNNISKPLKRSWPICVVTDING